MGSSKRCAHTHTHTHAKRTFYIHDPVFVFSTQPHSRSSLEQLLTVPSYEDGRGGEVKCKVENKELRDGHDRITGATVTVTVIVVGVGVGAGVVIVVLVAFVAVVVASQLHSSSY